MRHPNKLLLIAALLLAGCPDAKQFYLLISAKPGEPAGLNVPGGQLIVDLSYDGSLHEITVPATSSSLTLPDDFTITFDSGFEPSAAHTNGAIGLSIDVVDENQCVIACGTLTSAPCCNDTLRLGKDLPVEVQLFPLGAVGCLAPATATGRDCRECGNGIAETGEECDDANSIDTDDCTNGCLSARCGDGVVRVGVEACDDGNPNNNDACKNDCTLPVCGDGVLSTGEQCDDSNTNGTDACTTLCQNARCGDGFLHLGFESCDDGNTSNTDTCLNTCLNNVCGDGFVNISTEQCDDGNQNNTDSCSNQCRNPTCGNGIQEAGEACDDGNQSNTDACLNTCQNAICGDGFVRAGSEQCDDSNGVNTDSCLTTCVLAQCGDGFVRTGVEQCDDGDTNNNDACTNTCQNARCNDGITFNTEGGTEQCDDVNSVNTDACTNACQNARCGDAIAHMGVEQCDDGNQSNTDACPNTCFNAICGDTFIHAGSEQCDDGNQNNNDSCKNDCTVPQVCGDGVLSIGEECEDGNINNNDGCSSSCLREIVQISAGGQHTCVLLNTGNVRCWGGNNAGQLGYGNTNQIGDNETPASAGDVNIGGTVVQISAGGEHTCVLLDTGNVRCWGRGSEGQLGYGNTNNIGDNETPASANNINVGGTVVQLSAGFFHTCALLDTGNVRCWGGGFDGRLGYGNTNNIGDNETPASAGNINVGGAVVQISAGEDHTCALLNTGNVRCWGRGSLGELGYGNTNNIGDNETPNSAGDVNVGGVVTQLTTGGAYTCALLSTGNARCWGHNNNGELGYGNTNRIGDNETPASIGDVNVGGPVVQINLSETNAEGHTCALLNTGDVRCWGFNGNAELGYGNTTNIGDNETPASAGNVNVGGTVVQISAGKNHTCVLLDTGNVRCWGNGFNGQLGYGNTTTVGDNETPASAGNVTVF